MKLVNNNFGLMVNCHSHALRCYGDSTSKIVLVAMRDIAEGEELFFNYGYNEHKRRQINWLRDFSKKFLFEIPKSYSSSDDDSQEKNNFSADIKDEKEKQLVKGA